VRSENPHGDEECEEAEEVEDQHYTFDKGKFVCKKRVEKYGEARDCNDEKCAMPTFGDVSVIVQNDQALDLAAC
jgi:hypothetical protein